MIKAKIVEIIQKYHPEWEFADNGDFKESYQLDSFDIMVIHQELCVAFQISISGEKLVPENFRSLTDTARLVEECRACC